MQLVGALECGPSDLEGVFSRAFKLLTRQLFFFALPIGSRNKSSLSGEDLSLG